MLQNILLVANILVCIALIAVVLMQRSEGGALGMGGGPSGFMTARGAGDLLTRTTWILFGLFLALSLALTLLGGGATSVTERLKVQAIDPSQLNQPPAGAPAGTPPAAAAPPAGVTPLTTAPAVATPPATAPAPRVTGFSGFNTGPTPEQVRAMQAQQQAQAQAQAQARAAAQGQAARRPPPTIAPVEVPSLPTQSPDAPPATTP